MILSFSIEAYTILMAISILLTIEHILHVNLVLTKTTNQILRKCFSTYSINIIFPYLMSMHEETKMKKGQI